MEVPRDVWQWLCSVGAVASVRASKQATSNPNVVRVDQQTQAAMEVSMMSSPTLSILRSRVDENSPKFPLLTLLSTSYLSLFRNCCYL